MFIEEVWLWFCFYLQHLFSWDDRVCFVLKPIKRCWKHLQVEYIIIAYLLYMKDKFRTPIFVFPGGPGTRAFLNMNARLMQGTSLEITKKHMENCDWVAEKP